MTALRGFWTPILTFALCGCGARTDDSAASQRSAPVSGVQPAQPVPQASAPSFSAAPPVSQTSAPTGFIKPSPGPEPSGCCPSSVEQQAPPSSTPPNNPPPTEPARADAGAAPAPASDACFEYLGDWTTCEHAGEGKEEHTSAPDLQSCMELCLQRPDCTAVTDYFYLGLPGLGCLLYTLTCEAPIAGPGTWREEDAQRQYRKTCATQ